MQRIVSSITPLEQHCNAVSQTPEVYRPPACPRCGLKVLWRHGYYYRKADRGRREGPSLNPVPICRYCCSGCKRTCSRLPLCITTEYVDAEDRVRLAGEGDDVATVVIWLTQRLLGRLIPVLAKSLEQDSMTTSRADILQGWAQLAAGAETTPQPPVRASGANAWLAHAIDIANSPQGITLTFRGVATQRALLCLPAEPLRQWLNILHDACRKAEWPMTAWPDWIIEAASPVQSSAVIWH